MDIKINAYSRLKTCGRKPQKYQKPFTKHPETAPNIDITDIQANRLEAQNAKARRTNSTFRQRTNTYANKLKALQRTLDLSWILRNFSFKHFTTRVVTAVALAIKNKALKNEELRWFRCLSIKLAQCQIPSISILSSYNFLTILSRRIYNKNIVICIYSYCSRTLKLSLSFSIGTKFIKKISV